MKRHQVQVVRNDEGEVVAVATMRVQGFFEFPNGGHRPGIGSIPAGGRLPAQIGPTPEGAVMVVEPIVEVLINPKYRGLLPSPRNAEGRVLSTEEMNEAAQQALETLGIRMDPWTELKPEEGSTWDLRSQPRWGMFGPWDEFHDTRISIQPDEGTAR